MKLILGMVGLLAIGFPLGVALHDAGCVPTRADPSTINMIDVPNGTRVYVEERNCPLGTSPPPPLCGFLLGSGTWTYLEENGINAAEGSLQRGGCSLVPSSCGLGSCFPPDPLPCFILEDPVEDQHCGHGPDFYIL